MLLETDLIERRRKIQKQMGEIGMEGCLLTMPLNLYYLCGSVFNGYYYLPTEGEPANVCETALPILSVRVFILLEKPGTDSGFITGTGRKISGEAFTGRG